MILIFRCCFIFSDIRNLTKTARDARCRSIYRYSYRLVYASILSASFDSASWVVVVCTATDVPTANEPSRKMKRFCEKLLTSFSFSLEIFVHRIPAFSIWTENHKLNIYHTIPRPPHSAKMLCNSDWKRVSVHNATPYFHSLWNEMKYAASVDLSNAALARAE